MATPTPIARLSASGLKVYSAQEGKTIMDELKEVCPFCGGEPICEKKGNSMAHWIVRCVDCRALVKGSTEASAIEKWNRRFVKQGGNHE